MNYLGYWGLERRPFAPDDDQFFYNAGTQRETLAGLDYFVAGAWNSAFLVAPRRSGTTRLMTRLKGMSGFGDCAAEVILTSGGDNYDSVAKQLAVAIGIESESLESADRMEAIRSAIETTSRGGIRTVWLIDQCVPPAARLARDLVMADGDISVVMATAPENLANLSAAFGRCCMQIEIEPLELSDTFGFVTESLEYAGSKRQLFVDAAIVRLHEMSEGRIAMAATIGESSLRLAAKYCKQEVTPSVVEAVAQQMQQAA